MGQGSVISPLLSNIYAHPLDDYMIRQEDAHCLEELTAFAKSALKLTLNPYSMPIRSLTKGLAFLSIFFSNEKPDISTRQKSQGPQAAHSGLTNRYSF